MIGADWLEQMGDHWFWWLLTAACVAWYSTITVYVAFRGVFDIQHMLERLAASEEPVERPDAEP